MYKEIIDNIVKLNKKSILIYAAVLAIIVTGFLFFVRPNFGSMKIPSVFNFNYGNPDVMAKKAVEYLNKSIFQQGQSATLVSYSEESGVIKFQINIGGRSYDSYITKDGKLLFPEGVVVGTKILRLPVNQNPPTQKDTQNRQSPPAK